jgi:hypothetical protein
MDDSSAYNPTPNPGGYQPQPGDAPVQPQGQPVPQNPSSQQRAPLRIDHNLLAELGLGTLPDDEKKALEKHIYETLEMRVGMRLADQMTNEQLDEFETYFNARDDAGAFRWLETNFPNYKDIVAEEFDKLKAEVGQNAPHILAASQQQGSAPQSGPGPMANQPPPAPQDTYQPPQPPLGQQGQPGLPPTDYPPQPPYQAGPQNNAQ